MNIIKSGIKNAIEKCYFCDCEFEYNFKDQFAMDDSGDRYVRCPECDSLIKTRDYQQDLKNIKKYMEETKKKYNNKEDLSLLEQEILKLLEDN